MADSSEAIWDVIILGGGPAGFTAATVLAQAGRRVLVLEKTKFPRFHIGESLLPYNREIFEQLGVWEQVSAAGFVKKRGAEFIMGNDSRRNRLDFSNGSFTEFPESLQVDRATFDQILLDHARESGAHVREESNSRLASPRMLRVGDAAGFIDPMFSSGVLLAMSGARDGARAIDGALRVGKPLTPDMKRYEKRIRQRTSVFWGFIENFYELRFTQLFFQPYNRWRLVCAINTVLAGRTELPFAVRWRLRVFFLLVRLNRHLPLAPRIEVS